MNDEISTSIKIFDKLSLFTEKFYKLSNEIANKLQPKHRHFYVGFQRWMITHLVSTIDITLLNERSYVFDISVHWNGISNQWSIETNVLTDDSSDKDGGQKNFMTFPDLTAFTVDDLFIKMDEAIEMLRGTIDIIAHEL